MRHLLLLTGFLFASMGSLNAEEESAPLAIGQPAPRWENLPGVDGKNHSLDELKDKKAILVVFFANHCPDCQDYLHRILELARDVEKKEVAVVLISVSRMEEDGIEEMKKMAGKGSFPCQYLKDESQKIGRAFGASATPEVFLFDGDRRLVYHGALDDHWNPTKVKRNHARLAIEEIVTGRKVSVPTTEPKGCFIEYEEE